MDAWLAKMDRAAERDRLAAERAVEARKRIDAFWGGARPSTEPSQEQADYAVDRARARQDGEAYGSNL